MSNQPNKYAQILHHRLQIPELYINYMVYNTSLNNIQITTQMSGATRKKIVAHGSNLGTATAVLANYLECLGENGSELKELSNMVANPV